MNFKETYKSMVDNLQPSQDLVEKLQITEEARIMKFNKRRVAVVAAVACMMIGTTVFAAGHIASYRSLSNPHDTINDYDTAIEKSAELGSELTIPEEFSNGYKFNSANVDGRQGLDENGNVLVQTDDFTAKYLKDGEPSINLFVNTIFEEDEERYAVDSKMIGDVEVYFNQATYKFVPTDYEFTDEDNANIDDPHYEISYGSDEVEVLAYSGVSFVLNDKYYSMFAWDSNMTADEWYEMAEELLTK